MSQRRLHSSGAPWEPIVGYSRAVRIGQQVWVSGTTATGPDGKLVGVGDMAAQARQVFQNLERALRALGAELRHVVRSRIYVTDITRWEEVGRVHGGLFAAIRPASTLVEVSGLVDPQMLVEIEVDAVVDG